MYWRWIKRSWVILSFLNEKEVKIIGVEAAGKGVNSGQHAASLSKGKPGFLHGNYTYLLQDKNGQILDAHSISAGLDYPGIGPEHSWLKDIGRVEYHSSKDQEALNAFKLCCRLEVLYLHLNRHMLLHFY